MVPDTEVLSALAVELGVHAHYVDGLGRAVDPGPESLLRVCRALGAPMERLADAPDALRAVRARKAAERLPPVVVAWHGHLNLELRTGAALRARVELEDGGACALTTEGSHVRTDAPLPFGYHRLVVEVDDEAEMEAHVIASPMRSWRRPDSPGRPPSWGVCTHLAALRTRRSRSVGDLRDLEYLSGRMSALGADVVTVLPLLPTFNDADDPEPSPYSPVSRLFWSELILDLEGGHAPVARPQRIDVAAAHAEVRARLAAVSDPDPSEVDTELAAYARFRGAQVRLGRNWRQWPAAARNGRLSDRQVDAAEEAFHRKCQVAVRRQLAETVGRMEGTGVRLGLDLAVGVHPDGFDTWSRPDLFADRVSVGAPPDPGFPSGQDWGFHPVDPEASRREGHRYFKEAIAHQARVSGVLRVDHVMALTRLYWIPHGLDLHQGTYVSYPTEELFAVLVLESHRCECEIVGENLGVVPPEISAALPRHGIRGMHLTLFAASDPEPRPPDSNSVGLVGTHDTATFAGWTRGADIDARVECGLLAAEEAPAAHAARRDEVWNLARTLGTSPERPGEYLEKVLCWLGGSDSPLILVWIEDFWLEEDQVNLPGTRSSDRPNWQRPLRAPLEELLSRPDVDARFRLLRDARERVGGSTGTPDSPDPTEGR